LCAAQQHVDNHIAVEHLASHTVSEQTFRSIVGAHGRGVFNGKVVVHEGTKGISANQASDNLLLDDTGEIDTKPELEIHTDDVKCSHGATVGELDEVQLFYLKTRGIADAAARGLLTLGFANEILQRLDAPGLAELVVAKFGLALPDDPTWRAPA
jgi:Fe-S cluster assembly protein SufD